VAQFSAAFPQIPALSACTRAVPRRVRARPEVACAVLAGREHRDDRTIRAALTGAMVVPPAPNARAGGPTHKHTAALFGALTVLLLSFCYPASWTANEEDYFQLAYRSVRPERFTENHAIFDHSRARALPEYLFGTLVDRFGFEDAHRIGRLGMALLYAAGLTFFFGSLPLTIPEALSVVVAFRLLHESILGGEWLFEGVESKTLAYALVFFALGLTNRERWLPALILAAVATYVHFLVGGFWALAIVLTAWWRTGRAGAALAHAFIYCVLVCPILVVIAHDQLGSAPPIAHTTLSAGEIYAAIRNPHHLAPFSTRAHAHSWWPHIRWLVLVTVLFIAGTRRSTVVLRTTAAIGLLHLFVALLLSYLDRSTFVLSQLYLFRPSSVTLFLVLAVGMSTIPERLRARRALRQGSVALVIGYVVVEFVRLVLTLERPHTLPYAKELVAAIEAHSQPGDIVLLEPRNEFDARYLRLHRDIDRPTVVSYKFVPTNPADILRWYGLIQRRAALFAHGCSAAFEPRPTLLVVFDAEALERIRDCGPVVWRNGAAAVVRVQDR
jgi:hypothetical protein